MTSRAPLLTAAMVLCLLLAAATVGRMSTSDAAWTVQTSNVGTSVSASTVAAPTGVNAVDGGGSCATVNVTWGAAAGATGYRVEVRSGSGSWVVRSADTGNVTTYADTAGYANTTLTYRVTALLGGTSWESAPAVDATPLTCGIGSVSDLAATNACSDTDLSWSAATNANNYDVYRRVNAGTWTAVVTNQAGTTWSDATVHPTGATVEYYVVPGNGTANGNNSNIAVVSGWDTFRVTAITITNNGLANVAEAGDTIAVTFTKPSDGITPGGTGSTSIYVQAGTGARGLYLSAATNAAASSGIGRVAFGANIVGTTGVHAGTTAWSGSNTVWTWTRGAGAGISLSAPTWGAFTVGTSAANPSRVRCSDGTVLQASTPVMTGWF